MAVTAQHFSHFALASVFWLAGNLLGLAQAVPSPEEPPEEVLQLDMLLPAYSPQTGQAQLPAIYAETKQTLQVQAGAVPPQLPSAIPATVNSLRLLKFLKSLLPFL